MVIGVVRCFDFEVGVFGVFVEVDGEFFVGGKGFVI